MSTSGHRRSVVDHCWLALALGMAAGCAASTSSADAPRTDAGGGDAGAGSGGRSGGTGGAVGSGGNVSGGSGGASGTGGARAGTGGAAAGTGGAGGASAGCSIDLSLVPPQNEGNLVANSKTRVRVRGQVLRPGPKPLLWTWAVEFQQVVPPDSVPYMAMVDPLQPDVATVDFPVLLPGNYKVSLSVDSGVTCSRSLPLLVGVPGPATYTVRITPPLSLNLEVPVQEVQVQLQSATAGPTQIALSRGIRRSVSAVGPNSQSLPAYVRVSDAVSSVVLEGYTARGPLDVFWIPPVVQDVLIVPDGDIAPLRLSVTWSTGNVDNTFNPLPMTQGTAVRGALLNSDGTGIAGARIVFRDGMVPSTLGTSDATGKFSLWARPGAWSVIAVPPPGAGLAEAHVPASPGVQLGTATTDLTMTWKPVTRGSLSLVVKAMDGAAPAVGARVRLEPERDAETAVATLRVTGTTVITLAATGSLRVDVTTDANGLAAFGKVPVGAYKLTVVPPPEMPAAALTIRHVTVTTTGLIDTAVLARHLILTGTLLPKDRTRGVRVIARDQSTGVQAPTVSAVADAKGVYALSIDPERTYRLTADPPAGSMLARTIVGDRALASADGTAPDYTVAPAVPFTGKVTVNVDGSARMVGGAVVQVFCVGTALSCANPDSAIAEAITDETGTFTVALPDPQAPIH